MGVKKDSSLAQVGVSTGAADGASSLSGVQALARGLIESSSVHQRPFSM
jgi:hypothetical protein